MKKGKRIGLILLVLFILIQFIKTSKNQPVKLTSADITKVCPMQKDVNTILSKACYDCHSNNTVYPWYSNIPPVGWWLNNHINNGKQALNLSEFGTYPIPRQFKKLEEIAEEVNQDAMPLKSYRLIHTNARLTNVEKQTLYAWCDKFKKYDQNEISTLQLSS